MLILLMGLVFIVGMNRFIDGYYYGKKIETMNRIISDIDKMYKVSSSEDEALMNIEYMGYHFEGKISIFDRNTKKVIFDSKRYQYTEGIILQELSHGEHTAYIYETEYPVKGARWLIYIDQLENGKIAVLQIPVVAIDEAISVLNVFFNYLMMVALTIAVILAFILSKNISSPICQLRKVADSIEKLDFDVKYEGKRADEIGQLGTRLNQISDTLQKNICDLHRELEKEKNIDRMRRRFVAQVSHELQTPITIISSYMEALSDGIVEEEEIPGYYKVIEDESEKMSKIIKDLLQLSNWRPARSTSRWKALTWWSCFAAFWTDIRLWPSRRASSSGRISQPSKRWSFTAIPFVWNRVSPIFSVTDSSTAMATLQLT